LAPKVGLISQDISVPMQMLCTNVFSADRFLL